VLFCVEDLLLVLSLHTCLDTQRSIHATKFVTVAQQYQLNTAFYLYTTFAKRSNTARCVSVAWRAHVLGRHG